METARLLLFHRASAAAPFVIVDAAEEVMSSSTNDIRSSRRSIPAS
jgi:hypothetical protein